ncbi:protein FAM163A-like [Erpetoichthys calabaricus]|uniref:protein FAM163A-like n=1 Tax=Erpetoichthys calabaricus TaxID=27687 RepID=UPI002234ACE4|nr:protein FAM163A-like [Erpetoichthys calabaricus]
MTAGTVVITGGILATVILLCIIAVLCYCRLQYYCCKKEESYDEEEESDSPIHPQFACNACSSQQMDGPALSSLVLPTGAIQHGGLEEAGARAGAANTGPWNYCPTCSPYNSPFYIRTTDEMRNGGERITYTPTRYEDSGLTVKMSTLQSATVSHAASTRAISTEV